MMARTFGMKSEPSPPIRLGGSALAARKRAMERIRKNTPAARSPNFFQEHCFDPSFLCLSFHSCCLIRITLLYTGTPYVHCDGNTRIRRYLMSLIHFHKYST